MIKDVTALFKDVVAKLPPITRKPTNNALKHLWEVLRNLLQAVKLPGGMDAKWFISSKTTYQAAHTGAIYDRLEQCVEAVINSAGVGCLIGSLGGDESFGIHSPREFDSLQ